MEESQQRPSEGRRTRVTAQILGLRILVGVVLVPIVIAFTYFGGLAYALLVSGLAGLGCYEFCRMFSRTEARPSTLTAIVGSILVCFAFHLGSIPVAGLALAICVVVIFVGCLGRSSRERYAFDSSITLMGLVYTGWLLGFFISLRSLNCDTTPAGQNPGIGGRHFVYYVLVLTWAYDSVAYLAGSFFGRRKIFPRISPSKTVEGTVSGLLGSVAASLIAMATFASFVGPAEAILLGLLLGAVAQAGDLVESMIKRSTGAKDASNMIPGHGGFLDRFDSLLFTGPVFYLYVRFVVC